MAESNGEKPKGSKASRKATALDKRIGAVMRRQREALDLSLEKAADIAGWDYSRARRLEVGSSKATYNDAHAYLDALGVPLTAFYRDKDLGFVMFPSTTEDAVATDPDLTPAQRIGLRSHIRTLKREAAEERARQG